MRRGKEKIEKICALLFVTTIFLISGLNNGYLGLQTVWAEENEMSGICGSNANYALNEDASGGYTLTISGNGELDYHYAQGNMAWKSFNDKINTVVIEEGITSIPMGYFEDGEMEKVVFPSSLTTLGDYAFRNCKKLNHIYIGKNMTKVEPRAFDGCDALTDLVVDEENAVYDSRDNCNAIIETATDKLVAGCNGSVIVKGIKEIGTWAFCERRNFSEISFPDSLETIGYEAFAGCFWQSNNKDLVIPDSVSTIGDGAFSYCGIESVYIGKNVSAIGRAVFYNNVNIKELKVSPENITYDSRNDCNAIIETATNKLIQAISATVIPDDIVTIGEHAFACVYIKTLTIPITVKTIERCAFDLVHANDIYYNDYKSKWDEIVIDEYNTDLYNATMHFGLHDGLAQVVDNEGNVKNYYKCADCDGLFWDIEGKEEVDKNDCRVYGHIFNYYSYNYDATCEADGTKTAICENGCGTSNTITDEGSKLEHELTKHDMIPATCVSEGKKQYYSCDNCGKLFEDEEGTIPITNTQVLVIAVDNDAHTVVIDQAVKAACETEGLGQGSHCSSCNKVFIEQKVIPAAGHKNKEIRNTSAANDEKEGYTGDEYCLDCGKKLTDGKIIPKIAKSEEPEKPSDGDDVKDDKETGNYEVISSEKIEVKYETPSDTKQKTINVPNTIEINGENYTVTEISDNAFKGNKTITKITIGKNVTSIGNNAFNGASKLTKVSVGKNVETVGNNAFKGCVSLKSITLNNKVKKIGSNAFNGCKKLKTLTIKSTKLSDKNLNKKAFKGIKAGTTIKVPKKKLNAYKKLFQKKGLAKTVKIEGF